jgi:murein DD-endopeptidase MepM/ murein hydrolase activator NlpD
MLTIQTLRRSRGLTLIDIAMLSGIPARTLGAIECGVHRLDHRTREQLASIFAVAPESLVAAPRPPLQDDLRRRMLAEARAATPMIGAALATAILLAPAVAHLAAPAAPAVPSTPAGARPLAPASPASAPSGSARFQDTPPTPASFAPAAAALLAPPALPPMPTAEVLAPALPAPAQLAHSADAPPATDEPYGCPLATSGQIVITQGYGVGTHAPAEIWGGIDLAVVASGDGPGATATTRGTLVFTPIGGVAFVALDSWPGGNYVRIVNSETGWSTAYAHLEQVFVASGQRLEPGTVIGSVGSTGMSTGPHLHYEVWRRGVNQDPTPFLRCG